MHILTDKIDFPDPAKATPDGLLAIGGDLSVRRLLQAYNVGVFPWFEAGQPILWWSPDPRMVLFPQKFRVSKTLQKILKSEKFKVTFNTAFPAVIKQCATVSRKGHDGTWITPEMQLAYIALHNAGHALSIEVWYNESLVGGLYGIDLPNKRVFCGESMFSLVNNASKVAFYHLSEYAQTKKYRCIDCQIYNEHLESMGAEEIGKEAFLQFLSE